MAGHVGLATLAEEAEWLGISVITSLEFSGFAGLTNADHDVFNEFCHRVEVVDLRFSDQELIGHVNELRRSRSVKLPDAIILGTAVAKQAAMMTADDKLLRLDGVLPGLEVCPIAGL